MTYGLEIRPDALADIEEAARWYDEQQSGLGSEFAREVLDAIDTVLKNPLSYRLRHKRKNVRWKLLDRFPYRIVFRITEDLITVVAVIHSARHDRHWKRRS
ncbi:MAG TPA: type II toxin-antitoxin system RelE/ParE family toxin [Pyrinomonadaceae bacterium]